MKQGFFVTGTDTEIGKTAVSCALLRSFSLLGLKSAGMKPVSSGGGDAERLAKAASLELPVEFLNPFSFNTPVAPHIAALNEGRKIDIGKIVSAYESIEADVVVVEGVGGFMVPLNEDQDVSDLAQSLGLPVILVVGMKLGAINHARLTFDAIRARGIECAGWVANRVDPEMAVFDEVLESIRRYIDAPLIDVTPFDPEGNFLIDVSSLVNPR